MTDAKPVFFIKFSVTLQDWLSTKSLNLGLLMTTGVKLLLPNCSHFETSNLKFTDFLGEFCSLWWELFNLEAMSVTVLGFNLFKLFIIGELVVCGCLNLLDAVLTGDVFFTVSLLRISLVFLLFLTSSVLVAASGSSLGLFLLYFPLGGGSLFWLTVAVMGLVVAWAWQLCN